METDNSLESLLQDCELSPLEAQIMSSLFNGYTTTAGVIAKRTKIKRPTVYHVLNNLIERGLVTRSYQNNTAMFSAIEPELFVDILEARAKQKYEETSQVLQQAADVIKLKNKASSIAGLSISTLESADAVSRKLLETLLQGSFYSIFNPQVTLRTTELRKVVKDFLKKTNEQETSIKELLVFGEDAKWYKSHIKNSNHQVRFLPENLKVSSDMIITSESVLLSSYTPKHEAAITISQDEFVTSMQALFEHFWSLSD
ncbi:MAG: helix-turn-helix domain-containing protein [Bdellovibrionota bacterium]